MIHVALVEDEQKYVEQISSYLEKYGKEKDLAIRFKVYSDGDGILEDYNMQYDIILMDIQMKFVNGMSAASEIRKIDSEVMIIFITNYDSYAAKGYEVGALDYVLKPVSFFMLSNKLDKAIMRLNNKKGHEILINTKEGNKRVNINDMLYMESNGHEIIYHLLDEIVSGRGSMKECENKFIKYDFFRCNKGLLVNLKHVNGVFEKNVDVAGELLPVGRTRKKLLLEAMASYICKVVK